MTAAIHPHADGFPAAAPGAEVLGEIISWDAEGVVVGYARLVDALEHAGLDPAVARRMLPRNAFVRACRRLAEQRIIRKLDEDEDTIRFQFTAERKGEDELLYVKETVLALHKSTGAIECPDRELAARARAAVDEATGTRHGGDITRIVQRLFDDRRRADLDLVPIRPRGGCYFVRKERLEFVDRVERFLDRLHATMVRLPIAAGTAHGERSVREAVAARLSGLIGELESAVESFGTDTRGRTLEAAAARVRTLRFKVDSYAEYLDAERGRLSEALARASALLRDRVERIAAGRAGGG